MSTAQGMGSFTSAVVRRWPIVAGALIAGVLVSGAFALTDRAEPTWEGSVTVRYIPPSGVAGAPTPDTFVAMALSPSLQQSVAESIGVDPVEMTGSVNAAISPRDRTMVEIRVEAPSEDAAAARVQAIADAAVAGALEPVDRHTEYWEDTRIAEAERKLEMAIHRSETLRQQIDALPGSASDRRSFEDQFYVNELRIADFTAALEHDRFLLEGMRAAVTVVEDTAVEPKRTLVYDLTGIVRGALVGAFAGALVAAVAARRETSG